MNEKTEKLSVVPALAVRPGCPSDVGRVAISGGSVCFIIENHDAVTGLALIAHARDKWIMREYVGSPLCVLMGKLEFHPDMSGPINMVAPDFYSSDLFIGGGDPHLIVQQPTDDNPHAFAMLNAKTSVLSSQIPTALVGFKYWVLGVRNADSSLTTLLSIDDEQVGGANTRALLRGALHGR